MILFSQPVRAESDVEGCWQWDWAIVWRHKICLANVLGGNMFLWMIEIAVGVGVVFAHAKDRPGYM